MWHILRIINSWWDKNIDDKGHSRYKVRSKRDCQQSAHRTHLMMVICKKLESKNLKLWIGLKYLDFFYIKNYDLIVQMYNSWLDSQNCTFSISF